MEDVVNRLNPETPDGSSRQLGDIDRGFVLHFVLHFRSV